MIDTTNLEAAVAQAEAGKDSVVAFIAKFQALNAEDVKAAVTKAMAERDATDATVNAAVQAALDGVASRVTGIATGLAASIAAPPVTPQGVRRA